MNAYFCGKVGAVLAESRAQNEGLSPNKIWVSPAVWEALIEEKDLPSRLQPSTALDGTFTFEGIPIAPRKQIALVEMEYPETKSSEFRIHAYIERLFARLNVVRRT